jgi:hypothetical protein
VAVGVVLAMPCAAGAQTPPAAPDTATEQTARSTQTLVLEPIRSGPVIAPDVKVTDVDGSTEVLFGVWGGYLHDETWLFGAAGYWLLDEADGIDMSYGGFVAGWRAPAFGPIRFGVRGLVGGGWATVPVGGGWPAPYDRSAFASARHGHWPGTGYRVWYSDGFFVAEPQADVVVRLVPWLSLTGGVSYRWVDGDDILDDRLSGVAGSIALQFGVF